MSVSLSCGWALPWSGNTASSTCPVAFQWWRVPAVASPWLTHHLLLVPLLLPTALTTVPSFIQFSSLSLWGCLLLSSTLSFKGFKSLPVIDLAKVHLSPKRCTLILKWGLIFKSSCEFLKIKNYRKQISLSWQEAFYLVLSLIETACLQPILKKLMMKQSPLCLFLSLRHSFSPY